SSATAGTSEAAARPCASRGASATPLPSFRATVLECGPVLRRRSGRSGRRAMAKRQAACTHCGRAFQVDEANEGGRARCGACGQSFVVQFAAAPAASSAPPPSAVATEPEQDGQTALLAARREELAAAVEALELREQEVRAGLERLA